MKNIWKYSTQENGLLSNGIFCTVAGRDGIYAATEKGICSSSDFGKTWKPEVQGLKDMGRVDLSVNRRSGAILFFYDEDQGLGVKLPNQAPYYITRQDGIYNNNIRSIQIDESVAMDDPLGAVYLSHGKMRQFDPAAWMISRYGGPGTGWQVLPDKLGLLPVYGINGIRLFDGVIYVCTDGGLAISKDGNDWDFIEHFKFNEGRLVPYEEPASSISYVYDFHIDDQGDWYALLVRATRPGDVHPGSLSYFLRSSDKGKTWDIWLVADYAAFSHFEFVGDDVFVLSARALRVFNKKTGSVRLFDGSNGLELGIDDATGGQDKFAVDQTNIYLPAQNGIAIASLSDIAQYPPLFDYVTGAGSTVYGIAGALQRDPSETAPGAVFAGGEKGLASSQDGGRHWQAIDQIETYGPGHVDLSGQQINDIYVSDKAELVGYYGLATETMGLVRFNIVNGKPANAVNYTTKYGLASNRVSCSLFNRVQTAFMQAYAGHLGEGLSWLEFNDLQWKVVSKKDGLAGNFVLSIREYMYEGNNYLYVCGYDTAEDFGLRNKGAALSISGDGGKTWTSTFLVFHVNGKEAPLNMLYDVFMDEGMQMLYGMFATYDNFHDKEVAFMAKSSDNGASWTMMELAPFVLPDYYDKDCYPRFVKSGGHVYLATSDYMYILNFREPNGNVCAYWQDGLQGDHTGAVFVDLHGRIYVGTNGRGVALSKLDYVPLYDYGG